MSNHAVWPGIALLAVCGGCAPAMAPTATTATPAPERKVFPIACDDAHRYAATSLKSNQYELTTVERGPAGGLVRGRRQSGDQMEYRIICEPEGVRVATSGGGHWADQGMWFSFNQVVDRGDRIWPPPRGPQVRLQGVEGVEARLYFPQELEAHGVSAVLVRVVNGGERTIRVEPRRAEARTAAGGRTAALSKDGVRQRLGGMDPAIEEKLLPAVALGQGEEARGFLFFPAGTYQSVVLRLIDEPTGEADEFEALLGK
jgi:hypothetical protein